MKKVGTKRKEQEGFRRIESYPFVEQASETSDSDSSQRSQRQRKATEFGTFSPTVYFHFSFSAFPRSILKAENAIHTLLYSSVVTHERNNLTNVGTKYN